MKVSTQKEQKVNARFILRDREGVKLVEASTLLEKNNGELIDDFDSSKSYIIWNYF